MCTMLAAAVHWLAADLLKNMASAAVRVALHPFAEQ
jgi:hypothetical protein